MPPPSLSALISSPRPGKGGKTFLDSDDAKEANEPQKFLPDYDKLVKGKDADWVYFPEGSLKNVQDGHRSRSSIDNGRGHESRDAARDGQGVHGAVAGEGGLQGRRARAPTSSSRATSSTPGSRAARPAIWGGWMANPGVGLEVLLKDSSGKVVGEIRQKTRVRRSADAVENASRRSRSRSRTAANRPPGGDRSLDGAARGRKVNSLERRHSARGRCPRGGGPAFCCFPGVVP